MDWRGTLIDIFQVASILSAATFAALALFTDYKKDGKVTKYGRIAVAGIVLSALFSLGTRWAQTSLAEDQRKAAERKAAAADAAAATAAAAALAEREAAARRANEQMVRLLALAGDLNLLQDRTRALNRGMDASRRAQGLLLTSAGRSMLMTAQVGVEGREHTLSVLRGLWDGANRLGGDRIEVTADATCRTQSGETPPLFEAGEVTIFLWPERGGDSWIGLSRMLWSTRTEAMGKTRKGAMSTQFRSFRSLSLKDTTNPEVWRTAKAQVTVKAPYRAQLDKVAWVLPAAGEPGSAASQPVTNRSGFEVVRPLPCTLAVDVLANGYLVLWHTASVQVVRDAEVPTTGLSLMMDFEKPIADDILPTFSAEGPPPPTPVYGQ